MRGLKLDHKKNSKKFIKKCKIGKIVRRREERERPSKRYKFWGTFLKRGLRSKQNINNICIINTKAKFPGSNDFNNNLMREKSFMKKELNKNYKNTREGTLQWVWMNFRTSKMNIKSTAGKWFRKMRESGNKWMKWSQNKIASCKVNYGKVNAIRIFVIKGNNWRKRKTRRKQNYKKQKIMERLWNLPSNPKLTKQNAIIR